MSELLQAKGLSLGLQSESRQPDRLGRFCAGCGHALILKKQFPVYDINIKGFTITDPQILSCGLICSVNRPSYSGAKVYISRISHYTMPHQNCHLIESRLRRAESKLKQLRTDINIHVQYLKTHPGHQPTERLLAELRQLEQQQENDVANLQSDLDNCEAQNDQEKGA